MKLTYKDIYDKDFGTAKKGFDQQEVDDFLDVVIRDYQEAEIEFSRLNEEKSELENRCNVLEQEISQLKEKLNTEAMRFISLNAKIGKFNTEKEAFIKEYKAKVKEFVNAKHTMEGEMGEYQRKCDEIISDTERRAKDIVDNANKQAESIIENALKKEKEINENCNNLIQEHKGDLKKLQELTERLDDEHESFVYNLSNAAPASPNGEAQPGDIDADDFSWLYPQNKPEYNDRPDHSWMNGNGHAAQNIILPHHSPEEEQKLAALINEVTET